jgi:hypothetical protein
MVSYLAVMIPADFTHASFLCLLALLEKPFKTGDGGEAVPVGWLVFKTGEGRQTFLVGSTPTLFHQLKIENNSILNFFNKTS